MFKVIVFEPCFTEDEDELHEPLNVIVPASEDVITKLGVLSLVSDGIGVVIDTTGAVLSVFESTIFWKVY